MDRHYLDSCLFYLNKLPPAKQSEKSKYLSLCTKYRIFDKTKDDEIVKQNKTWWDSCYPENKSRNLFNQIKEFKKDDNILAEVYNSLQSKDSIIITLEKTCDINFLDYYLSQCKKKTVIILPDCKSIILKNSIKKEFKSAPSYEIKLGKDTNTQPLFSK